MEGINTFPGNIQTLSHNSLCSNHLWRWNW